MFRDWTNSYWFLPNFSTFKQIVYHSQPNSENTEPIEWHLQINTVKYYADQEITNTCENLQIVWSQFFTEKLILI